MQRVHFGGFMKLSPFKKGLILIIFMFGSMFLLLAATAIVVKPIAGEIGMAIVLVAGLATTFILGEHLHQALKKM